MEISGVNWANLPTEILEEMLAKLVDIEDLIRFGAVCHSWRSASLDSMKSNCGPWMMLSEPEPRENFLNHTTMMLISMFDEPEPKVVSDDDHHVPRRFINLSTNKTIEIYLPEAQGRRCWGSTFGWLFTIGLDLNIHLLNPLTRHQISLPSQSTFEKQYGCYVDPRELRKIFVHKVALSSHPKHQQDCVVMVIYSEGGILAIARPGDKAWTNVKCPKGLYDDVIFYNNLFYAIHSYGDLMVCDITTPVPVTTDFMPPPLRLRHSYRYYLVEMAGDLHLVVRMYTGHESLDVDSQHTEKFKVYKLNFLQKEWIKLRDLGDHALFLGNNGAFAILTSDHPEFRSNCIYFNDDYSELYLWCNRDMGIYDFGEKKIVDPLYLGDFVCTTFCAPLFFIPSLC